MEKLNKKVVFFGGGHMAEGIIKGLTTKGVMRAEDISVQELIPDRCRYLSEMYGVIAKTDASEEIKVSDLVLIGVNPGQVAGAVSTLKPHLGENTVVMSYAAGVETAAIAAVLGDSAKIARLIPNTLSLSGFGYSALFCNENISDDEKKMVETLVSGLGKVMYLPESKFNAFQVYGCTSPLWIYKFMEAMIDAGIYTGFTRAEAREQIIENMVAAAETLRLTGESPTARIEAMTSPGGITIEAVRVLSDNGGYTTPTIASMDEALKKCNRIGK